MLFIMRSPSCSGKDRFISRNFPNPNHVLSSDNFREMIIGNIASQQHNPRVFNTMYEILEMRMLNRVEWTVLNATNLRIKDVQIPIELCKKYHVPFTFISIQPPSVEELYARNQHRASISPLDVPPTVLERHHHRYTASMEPFLREALYNSLCTWIEIDQDEQVLNYVS